MQRVTVNNSALDWCRVENGIPQDSVLGLLLFIIFINDLEVGVTCNISIFADDTKLSREIKKTTDVPSLQGDLNWIGVWAET